MPKIKQERQHLNEASEDNKDFVDQKGNSVLYNQKKQKIQV